MWGPRDVTPEGTTWHIDYLELKLFETQMLQGHPGCHMSPLKAENEHSHMKGPLPVLRGKETSLSAERGFKVEKVIETNLVTFSLIYKLSPDATWNSYNLKLPHTSFSCQFLTNYCHCLKCIKTAKKTPTCLCHSGGAQIHYWASLVV